MQKMVSTTLKAVILLQYIPGSVQSPSVEAVTLQHQELVMVLFICGLLEVRPKTSDPYIIYPW